MLGQTEFKIGDAKFNISPSMLECEAFSQIRKVLENDELAALKRNNELLFQMIVRIDTSLTDEDKTELKELIAQNQKECLEESSILFKWTTREEREEHKQILKDAMSNGDFLKNLTGGKK